MFWLFGFIFCLISLGFDVCLFGIVCFRGFVVLVFSGGFVCSCYSLDFAGFRLWVSCLEFDLMSFVMLLNCLFVLGWNWGLLLGF